MKNKKGLGSIPKSLSWINSDETESSVVSDPGKKKTVTRTKPVAQEAEEVVTQPSKVIKEQMQPLGRINPQLSCTITPEDKELLNELALYACNRERKVLNTSVLIRALIRLGNKYKDELSFK